MVSINRISQRCCLGEISVCSSKNPHCTHGMSKLSSDGVDSVRRCLSASAGIFWHRTTVFRLSTCLESLETSGNYKWVKE